MRVIVMAKEPVPGRVKTRLCPPCTPQEAAALAEAALADTLASACASGSDEVVLALDGRPGAWCPAGVRVIPQAEGPFDERLAAAWATVGGPAVQIGMDTPHASADDVDTAMETLAAPGIDAVLGDALDGGWWLIGLRAADRRVFHGVPMSTAHTGRAQRDRLTQLGLVTADVAPMIDVDDIGDAAVVAASAPHTGFARVYRSLGLERRGVDGLVAR